MRGELSVKPAALRKGSRLAVLSPASTPVGEKVQHGLEQLKALGYKTVMSGHALDRGPLYYAGTLEERLADLHAAFADPEIDGIICTRGGWGSAELLPHLDAELIRANPKAFIGYSDHTSLHCWMQNEANLVTYYAPMVASDFAREDGVDLASWKQCFGGASDWSLGKADGLRVLRPGVAEGTLLGGCISILAQSLGTPYAGRVADGVLFLEDIGTKPYQWDRMLLHLKYAGLLEGARGIVFGDMTQCVAADEFEFLERAILHSLRDFTGPIAIGLRCGHVSAPNITLPLNVRVRLDLSDVESPRLQFLEAAVTG
ncbi:MAG: peptidase LD-carboxypeptidase [Acidobacteriaceae bacterium]|nr:peptidase LD-carboxypeptidase [Acidobacteriaceae bacterium]